MDERRELTVYVLVRTDLPSMNPGKAMSQSHHAGVQMMTQYGDHPLVQDYLADGQQGGADGFNTTIVLGATLPYINNMMVSSGIDDGLGNLVPRADMLVGVVVDPSYPFFVENAEIANLIPQTDTTKIVKVLDDGRVLMVREEVTCAWFLGDRNDMRFRGLFAGLDLHP